MTAATQAHVKIGVISTRVIRTQDELADALTRWDGRYSVLDQRDIAALRLVKVAGAIGSRARVPRADPDERRVSEGVLTTKLRGTHSWCCTPRPAKPIIAVAPTGWLGRR